MTLARALGSPAETIPRRAGGLAYAMLRRMNGLNRRGQWARMFCVVLLASALAAGGCGSEDEKLNEGAGGEDNVVVSAAQSLSSAFETYGQKLTQATPQFNFAGSDELATQIRSGAKPDVFASANTKLPEELFKEELLEQPVVFASNRLVLAVPKDSDDVRSLHDLTKDGVTLAIGSKDVPVGSYTRKVLERLGASAQEKILANVRTEEPNVAGIASKLTQGAVDAGFVYITDVRSTNGRVEALELPAELRPQVAYAAAVVKGARNRAAAQSFIDGLLGGAGAAALRDAGFEPPAA